MRSNRESKTTIQGTTSASATKTGTTTASTSS